MNAKIAIFFKQNGLISLKFIKIIETKHMIKRVIKSVINKCGYNIVKWRRDYALELMILNTQKIIEKFCPDAQYVASYKRHEAGHWGPIPALLFQRAHSHSLTGKKMLDIGCAFGTLLGIGKSLGWHPVGIDFVPLEEHMGEKVRRHFGIKFHQLNVETDPLPFKKKFDVVVMAEVLEHMHFQPLHVMKKVKDILDKDGCLLLSTPALGKTWRACYYNCPFENIPQHNNSLKYSYQDKHMKIYGIEELRRLLAKSGFKSYVGLYINPVTGLEHLYAVAFYK